MSITRKKAIEIKKEYSERYSKIWDFLNYEFLIEKKEILRCESENERIEDNFLNELGKTKNYNFDILINDMNKNVVSMFVFYINNQTDKFEKAYKSFFRKVISISDTTDFDLKVQEVRGNLVELDDNDGDGVVRLYNKEFKQLKTIHNSIRTFSKRNFFSLGFWLIVGTIIGNVDRIMNFTNNISSISIDFKLMRTISILIPILLGILTVLISSFLISNIQKK